MDCLGTETVALYVGGALGTAMRARADVHVDRCPACRTLIARAARMISRDEESATDPAAYAPVRPTAGTRLGRYVIRDVVGRGAMGVVLSADDPVLGRAVALKLLHHAADDETDHAALLGEARKLARLSDPNVVQVFDVGTWCGRLFLAMELIDGASLRRASAEHAYTRGERLEILIAAGRGLAAAHAVGIVHRDFKPDNVLIEGDGRGRRVLVGDFGLALSTTLDRTEESSLGDEDERIVGTPAYMAPEQRVGGNVDARADQFAFCVTAVEVLLGWRPQAIADQRDALRFRARARSLPRRLVRALARGLAVEPARRHRDVEALLLGLEQAAP
ncbi:MAG TPA: serine/threonine-protein kinase, partial [Nannocystaceae bacterium]|nr:serine/threonine-protein kinase [Nannocystaceae bacterium]